MSYPSPRPGIDKHINRKRWEDSWASDLELFYNQPSSQHRRIITALPADFLSLATAQEFILHLDRKAREIIDLQNDLSTAAVKAIAQEDFETEWMRLSAERRSDLILEGIYRASCAAHLETYRGLCPEVTLRALSRDGGRPYLELVKRILPQALPSDTATITDPVYVHHPTLEHMFELSATEASLPGAKNIIRSDRLDRMYFMTMALWNVFLAFVRASSLHRR